MKKIVLIFLFISILQACGNSSNPSKDADLEKEEMEKVEAMQKTDKEKEDSMLAKWQKKMDETEVKQK